MAFADTVLHTGRYHAVAIGDALEDRLDGQPGTFARQGFEAQGVEDDMTLLREVQVFEGPDDPFRCGYFMHHAAKEVFTPHGIDMCKLICAAIDGVELIDVEGHVARVHPLGEQFGIGECLEDEVAGGVEFAVDEELLLSGFYF